MTEQRHKWEPERTAPFQPFDCAPGLRLAAHEKVAAIHHENLCQRLERLEEMIERLEKRLWLTVYGVVGVILAQAFQSLLQVSP